MKSIIYNAETGETTIEEVSDVEMPIAEEVIDTAKEAALLAMLKATTLASFKVATLNFLEAAGISG